MRVILYLSDNSVAHYETEHETVTGVFEYLARVREADATIKCQIGDSDDVQVYARSIVSWKFSKFQ